MADQNSSEMARAIQEVTEKAQLLVREEVALAKAEVSEKASKLIKGAIFGVVAAIFLVFALIYLLHSLALGIWSAIGSDVAIACSAGGSRFAADHATKPP